MFRQLHMALKQCLFLSPLKRKKNKPGDFIFKIIKMTTVMKTYPNRYFFFLPQALGNEVPLGPQPRVEMAIWGCTAALMWARQPSSCSAAPLVT